MSNYTKTVDFAAKDTLPSGDSGKIIKGTEFETEFDNISTAIATKADSAAPTFTGTSVFTNLDINGTVQADGAVTVGVDDTGYDVKFFGATAGKSLLWDESADSLIVTGTTTLVGTTNLDAVDVDGDMTFGDNNKAIFGDGSDLQIYHDGDTSYISHNTTGTDLVIQATSPGDDVIVRAADDLNFRVNGNENGIVVVGDGATSLYHANSQKITTTATGIDVTGSVTADGLTVDGGGTFTKNQTADTAIEVSNLGTAGATTTASFIISEEVGTPKGWFRRYRDGTATTAVGFNENLVFEGAIGSTPTNRMKIDSNGDISFYNDAAAQALFWDSSASALGLGTTTPDGGLDIEKTVNTAWSSALRANDFLQISNISTTGGSYSGIELIATGVGAAGAAEIVCIDSGSGSGDLAFSTRNSSTWSEKMRIDASGNLGIGTDSPDSKIHLNDGALHVQQTDGSDTWFGLGANNDNYITTGASGITVFRAVGTERMRIDASGHAIIPAGVTLGTAAGVYDAAKTLDDYEEGTWTPVIAGGTCTNMTGKYTKVGNQVTVILAVVNGNLAGTSGNVITGLPFTSTTRSTSGAVAFYNIFSVDDPVGYLGAGVTSINFIQNTASSSWSVANFSNSAATYFHFSLTYFV